MRSAAHPVRGIAAEEVTGPYGKRFEALDLGAAIPPRKLHRHAGSSSIPGAKSDGHSVVEKKRRAIRRAKSESYAPVELSAILLECQRIENVRASSGFMPFGGKGLGDRRERTGDQYGYGGTLHGFHRTARLTVCTGPSPIGIVKPFCLAGMGAPDAAAIASDVSAIRSNGTFFGTATV